MPSMDLPVSVPRLRAMRWSTDTLHVSIKEHHIVARVESGRLESFTGGRIFRSEPGCLHVKQPGDVYRELGRDGPGVYTIVVLPDEEVERLKPPGSAVVVPHMERGDARAGAFHRLVDAVIVGEDRLGLEVALAEAVSALAGLAHTRSRETRLVRRAMEYMRARMAGTVTLDELAAFCERDKFYLARAFRSQVGMAPHAYLTHLRISRAKALLAGGERPSNVALRVGFYDQAQLTRHFRRIVGTTPARFRQSRAIVC